jgi:hypothetical protein
MGETEDVASMPGCRRGGSDRAGERSSVWGTGRQHRDDGVLAQRFGPAPFDLHDDVPLRNSKLSPIPLRYGGAEFPVPNGTGELPSGRGF